MRLQEEKPIDRPYLRPQLVIYGDIQEITQTSSTLTMGNDGGPVGSRKTS
jgi:hypothetical protein